MTSNHEGVSCDICRKNNFRGLRYKCLVCYDYDLCPACYEAGLTSSRHTINHPMQCIVAGNDYDLFYSGETVSNEQPQSLTCPLCGILGFTEPTLLDHVTGEHANSDSDESSAGVVCPICGVGANQLTYDFATHLTMEHRTPRDQIEQVSIRGRGGRCHTRASGQRGRRSQTHYSTSVSGIGANNSSPSARDSSTNPIVEMLAQLSGVRRAGTNQSPASHLHQLQMQLQSSPSFSSRTSNSSEVRIMRRTFQSMNNQLDSSTSSATSTANTRGLRNSGCIRGISSTSYTSAHPNYGSSQPFILMDQGSLAGDTIPSAAGATAVVSSVAGGSSTNGTSTTETGLTGATHNQSCMLNNQLGTDNANLSSQYLLSSCMKPAPTEAEQQQREILKADRSLFVQELLLQCGLLERKKS